MFKGTPKRYSKHVTPDLRRTVASMGAVKKTVGLNLGGCLGEWEGM